MSQIVLVYKAKNEVRKTEPVYELKRQSRQLEELSTKLTDAYNAHKIDDAYAVASEILKLQTTFQVIKPSRQISQLIAIIQEQYEQIKQLQSELNSPGWNLKSYNQGIKISSRMAANDLVSVLVESTIEIPVQNFISTMFQIDLMSRYIPFMEFSKLEKIVSRNRRIGHSINNFPILARRQSFFEGVGYDRINHNGSLFIYSRSLHDKPWLQKRYNYYVKPDPESVQLDYKLFVIELKLQSRGRAQLRMGVSVDMKLSLPSFIMDPICCSSGQDLYQRIYRIGMNFKGSDWERKSKENPQFQSFVRDCLYANKLIANANTVAQVHPISPLSNQMIQQKLK